MSAYYKPVSIRKLFAVLLTLAVLSAPSLTASAVAAVPDHHAQMMEVGHCEVPPPHSGDHGKARGKNCCISMSMAVAVSLPAAARGVVLYAGPPPFRLASQYRGCIPEIATPPPRLA